MCTVQHEMTFTLLGYTYQKNTWQGRAERSVSAGSLAYANKQVAMWQHFVDEAQRGFEGLML